MNLVDCTVLEVIKKYPLIKGQMEWVKDDYNIYRVKAISWGNEFMTTIWVKQEEDKGQVKKGYVFQQ